MAYEKQNAQRDLSALTEKAVRRRKKLEKTHLKIVVQSETVSPTVELLKLVRLDVKKLKEHAEEFDRTLVPNSKKPRVERKPQSEKMSARKDVRT